MERVSHPVQGNREAVAVFSRQRPCGVPLHVFDPKASAGKALVAVLDDFEQIGWFATCSQPGSRTTSAGSRRGDGQEADQKESTNRSIQVEGARSDCLAERARTIFCTSSTRTSHQLSLAGAA
jgi:hypothetical protein